MAQNIGTLVTSAIRPNDSNDPIASAFASEIKGGLHTVNLISDRDNIIIERRDWGMMCYVIDEDKTYQLKYGYVDFDIMNNYNWVEFSSSVGGESNEWLDSVISILYEPPFTYSIGDRYLAGKNNNDSLLGGWTSFLPGCVLEWNSNNWVLTEPTNGTSIRVDNEDNSIYKYEGDYPNGSWYKEFLGQIRDLSATSIDGLNYISTTTPPFDSYIKDMLFLIKFDTINSGSTVSININSLGSIPIKKPSSSGLIDLIQGDIIPDIIYSLVYNGSTFELIKHYTGDNALNIRYYIQPDEYVVVPLYHQYWVYGNLTIDGEMTNYGQVVIANGNLINSNNFYNYGDLIFIKFDYGTGPAGFPLFVGTQSGGLTFSQNDELIVNVDDKTIKINQDNQIYVYGNSVYEWNYSNTTNGSNQPTGVTISNTPLNYSTVKVFINGQAQILGGSLDYLNSDCYFYDGLNIKDIDNITIGDELYWNGDNSNYNLSIDDKILFIYEK